MSGHYMNIGNCDQIYHSGNVNPFGFCWGVFIEDGHKEHIKEKTSSTIKDYSYLAPLETEYKNIINEKIIENKKL